MTDYVTFSGGEGSFRAALLWRHDYPDADMRLVFTDVLYEDADCYRFMLEGAAYVLGRKLDWVPAAGDFPDYRVHPDVPIEEYRGNLEWRRFLADLRDRAAVDLPELVWLVDGRDPWEVYRDRKMVGNSQRDPCSDILKRRQLRRYLQENALASDNLFGTADRIVFGIGLNEEHRFDDGEGGGIRPQWAARGWQTFAPLIDAEKVGRCWAIIVGNVLTFFGIQPARLYSLGYVHDNCGGMCCKGGHAHWQNRFWVQPDRFAYDAMMEKKVRVYLETDSGTFLSDRAGGEGKRPLSLEDFGVRIGNGAPEYQYEQGTSGCGCMVDGLEPA